MTFAPKYVEICIYTNVYKDPRSSLSSPEPSLAPSSGEASLAEFPKERLSLAEFPT